jgi:hypothetical protein
MARINRSFPISTQSNEALVESPSIGTFDIEIPQLTSDLEGFAETTSALAVVIPALQITFTGLVINALTGSLNITIPALQMTNFGGTAGAGAGGGMLLGGCYSGDNG